VKVSKQSNVASEQPGWDIIAQPNAPFVYVEDLKRARASELSERDRTMPEAVPVRE
jgi:hypothetical protein